MKFTSKKNIEENKGKYIVEFELKEWKDIIKKATNKLKARLQIPGFRKGKVPEEMVEKYLSDAEILNEAHGVAAGKAWQFALLQNDPLQPFNQPSWDIDTLSMKKYIISFEFDLKPKVEVEKYKNIKIEKMANIVNDEDVNQALIQLQEKSAILEIKEDKIANGDVVIFDFEGFKDGESFAGGKVENFNLEIGSKKFIPGFEEQMIGLITGEEKDLLVLFPKDYLQPDLAGKEVTFKVKIKEVKNKIVPEINDDLAKDANIDGVEDLAQLKNFIKENLIKQNKEKIKEEFINNLLLEISKTATIHISESVIDKEVLNLQGEFEQKLKEQNINLKQYLKLTKLTELDIKKELRANAKDKITKYLILEEIIKQENIQVNNDEVEQEIIEFAKVYKVTPEKVKNEIIDTSIVEEGLRHRKLLNFLYENNG
ncbi:trigger factor [Spiroplasma endosymbiont of Asaphidion curtum]|uniref:trigger factor n=1 Tax=Spiroplasma endosymbiont of Asaphidion curtum TaxID=3066281 RepID=UPI00313C0541